MLSIPGATIHTLRELFEDGATSIEASPFAEHIRKLDPTSQAYFENQFFTKTYSQTKQQIARRLYSVLQVPASIGCSPRRPIGSTCSRPCRPARSS